jgi:hypothetical protein
MGISTKIKAKKHDPLCQKDRIKATKVAYPLFVMDTIWDGNRRKWECAATTGKAFFPQLKQGGRDQAPRKIFFYFKASKHMGGLKWCPWGDSNTRHAV